MCRVLVIRALGPDEWRIFRGLRLEALEESPDAFGSTLQRERDADDASWRGWLTGEGWNADLTAFVAEDDGTPAGISVCARFHDEPPAAHLFAMWVRPSSRGLGMGRALVAAAVERARSLGVDELLLRVTDTNDAAVGLYTSCGFVGTADPPEPLHEGSAVQTLRMRLLLGDHEDDELMRQQRAYYDDRADEYDDWWFRRGASDRGPEENARWFEETARVEASLAAVDAGGDVLEIACGTGLWTRWLAPRAARLVALDTSPRMIERNRTRVGDPRVEYVQTDVFSWDAEERFDLIVAGFFVSHIPPSRFERFWGALAHWLESDGRVWIADTATRRFTPPADARSLGGPLHAQRREVGDRTYTIVKLFYAPDDLAARLDALGWNADLRGIGEHFLAGTAQPR
jgi:GNAT superfamily N-acetyltransferase/SAM-dependent methyltransferase